MAKIETNSAKTLLKLAGRWKISDKEAENLKKSMEKLQIKYLFSFISSHQS